MDRTRRPDANMNEQRSEQCLRPGPGGGQESPRVPCGFVNPALIANPP
jgi:hypothetical protein